MKKLFHVIFMFAFVAVLSGCFHEVEETEYSSDYSDTSGGGTASGADVDALAGSQTEVSFTCSTPGSSRTTMSVSTTCMRSQGNYAEVFSCNYVSSFRSACNSFYSCAVNNSTGDYVDYYQQNLDYCDNY